MKKIIFIILALLVVNTMTVYADEILCNPPLVDVEEYIGNSHISQKEDSAEEYPIYVLYSQPFSEDLLNTYQVVTTTDLNVRTGPGLKYPIFSVLKENEPVDVIIEEYPETGWIKVYKDCQKGFVSIKYIKVLKRSIYN